MMYDNLVQMTPVLLTMWSKPDIAHIMSQPIACTPLWSNLMIALERENTWIRLIETA